MSFDISAGGEMKVGVREQQGLPTTPEGVLASLPVSLGRSVIVVVNSKGPVDYAAFGGMWMRDDGEDECTSGFSVKHTQTNETGVVTAGHCTGLTHILHGGVEHRTVWKGEHRGAVGDFEWHTTNELEPDDFYSSNAMVTDVSAIEPRANILVNENVCLYGRASAFQDCSRRVADISESCTLGGVWNDRLVLMNGIAGALGDSGGPWFVGGRAYGVMKGLCGQYFNQAAWTVADLFDDGLLIAVMK